VSAILAGVSGVIASLVATSLSNRQISQQRQELERLRGQLTIDLLKHDVLTSISKEKFQEMYDKRISVYQDLLSLKVQAQDSFLKNADYIHFHDCDPDYFVDVLSDINKKTRSNLLYISNDLADVSKRLYEASSEVFANARIKSFAVEMGATGDGPSNPLVALEAEQAELRRVFDECGGLYYEWLEQLDKDVSEFRSVLDLTSGAAATSDLR